MRATVAVPTAIAAAFLVREENAVNQGIGALSGFDGLVQRFLAATVNTVGEDDERFAAWLFLHEFVGSEIDGVIEECAASVAMGAAPAGPAAGVSSAGRSLRKLRGMNLINGGLEFLAGGSEVLKEFDFVVEMNDEGFVFIFAEKTIEKRAAGGKFLIEYAALTEAGVDQEAEGEGEIGFPGEIGDSLRFGVLGEDEVFFGEVVDEGAVLVADGGEEIDGIDVEGDGGGLLGGERKEIKEANKGKEVRELSEGRACGSSGHFGLRGGGRSEDRPLH